MEILSQEQFIQRTVGGRPNRMDISPYSNKEFECGCGKKHKLGNSSVNVLRELTYMKLVVKSVECGYVNCIQVKGFFRVKLNTLFSSNE